MRYTVVPISFVVAYERPDGTLQAMREFCDPQAAQREALRLNAAWQAEQAKNKGASQRFVPPAQRRPVRSFPDDKFA